MKILFVTSEAAPYAASGGLGDVMGALPKSIADDNPDAELGVIVPLYDTMKDEHRQRLEKVVDISFRFGWRNTGASVYKLDNNGVNYYFVENHYYFDRGRLYGEFDDAERFAFFSHAVIEFMLATNSESFSNTAAVAGNNSTGKSLDTFVVAFDDLHINLDSVADRKFGHFTLQVFLRNLLENFHFSISPFVSKTF